MGLKMWILEAVSVSGHTICLVLKWIVTAGKVFEKMRALLYPVQKWTPEIDPNR